MNVLAYTVKLRQQAPTLEQDADKDGVPDSKDKCPKEPGDAKNAGCPIADVPAQSLPPGEDTPQQQALPTFKEPEMVFVNGSTFQMGCDEKRDGNCQDDEKPVHDVTLNDFSIGKYEVTNEEYAAFLNEYGLTTVKNGQYKGEVLIEEHEWGIAFRAKGDISKAYYESQKGYEKYPVVNITWYGAMTYAEWLSQKSGRLYRLPTEAEWEYAARGGSKSQSYRYAGTNEINELIRYRQNSTTEPHSVGSMKANELGIFDMSANVREWCSDLYGKTYFSIFEKDIADNPKGTVSGEFRVIRGGSFYDRPDKCRVAIRNMEIMNKRNFLIGFRIALEEYRASGK